MLAKLDVKHKTNRALYDPAKVTQACKLWGLGIEERVRV